MYLQKCEEYAAGQSYGVPEAGNMHKGIVCFTITGLNESIPRVRYSFCSRIQNQSWFVETSNVK